MQLVAADIGNSSTRVAVEHTAHDARWCMETIIRGAEPVAFDFRNLDIDNESAFWSVSSVNTHRQQKLAEWVAEHRPQDRFHLISADEVELETDVESRQRLGRDRLIAAWQAIQLNETGPVIVIDAGTAVTIDLIDEHAVFQGGLIFQGARSTLRNLAAQTDALPDLTDAGTGRWDRPDKNRKRLGFVGKSTESAMLLGVFQTQICTMLAAVSTLSKKFESPPEVYLTGGGIEEMREWLPDHWQFVPDLVLQGALSIGRRLQP